MTETQMIQWLLGNDPVRGNQAVDHFIEQGEAALGEVLSIIENQLDNLPEYQVLHRLARLVSHIGLPAVEPLIKVIETGEWNPKSTAAFCFRDLPNLPETRNPLGKLLDHGDYDVIRKAIHGLGRLGADTFSRYIIEAAADSRYAMDKLSDDGLEALTRMIAKETEIISVFYDLKSLESFLIQFFELLNNHLPATWELTIFRTLAEFTPVTADPLVADWLTHETALYRKFAVQALGFIRVRRVAKVLAERLLDPEEDETVRAEAAYSLGEIGGQSACEAIEEALNLPSLPDALESAIHWAFASLFYQHPSWENKTHIIKQILARDTEARSHLLYSFGILKAEANLPDVQAVLEMSGGSGPSQRGTAALALARLEGPAAIKDLRRLLRESANNHERAFILAGLITAGAAEFTSELHHTLCNFPTGFSPFTPGYGLRYLWRRELLFALAQGGESGLQQAAAWADISQLDLQLCLDEMAEILDIEPLEVIKSDEPGSKIMQDALQPDEPTAHASSQENIRKIDSREKERVIAILATQSANAPGNIGTNGYFRLLIRRSGWPDHYKRARIGAISGSPDYDAHELVDWAIAQGRLPESTKVTVLGSLLDGLKKDLGGEELDFITGLLDKINID